MTVFPQVDSTCDHESRAVTLTGPEMAQTNVYNGLDTRVGSTTNSVANTYLGNGAYVTAPVIKESNATFTPGVSERRGTTTTFSHSGLKNADAQSGVSQAVNATQQYDAFGNLASSTGTWQGQFGYGGGFGYQQDASGLKLLGHRYYDASTGRFLTRDPIKDGRNWYVYCDGDPVDMYDSGGLRADSLKGVGAGILATPGRVDRHGQFVIGFVRIGDGGRKFVDERVLHFSHAHGRPGYASNVPHIDSEVFGISHFRIPKWALALGNEKNFKGFAKGVVGFSLGLDIYEAAVSKDPAASLVKSATIWGAAAVGAAYGTSVMPGVGTIIGSVVFATVIAAIVYYND